MNLSCIDIIINVIEKNIKICNNNTLEIRHDFRILRELLFIFEKTIRNKHIETRAQK